MILRTRLDNTNQNEEGIKIKDRVITGTLAVLLLGLSVASMFVGVIDMNIQSLLSGDTNQWFIFLASRLPRLLAILCTGFGISVAGLIMQQLCMNKFVSPTTGATISAAKLGILIAFVFMPNSTLVGRAMFSFAFALIGTWAFVWFIQQIQFKDTIMVPLIGITFGNIIGGVTSFMCLPLRNDPGTDLLGDGTLLHGYPGTV